MISIRHWLQQATKALAHMLPLREARFEAATLLAYVLKKNRSYLISHDETLLTLLQHALATQFLNHRLAGHPIAYILGQRDFYGREFISNPSTLIPRADTETLITWCLDTLPKDKSLSLIDLGTGTGAIAVTLSKERPAWRISATDFSIAALHTARFNAQQHDASVSFQLANWYTPLLTTKSAKNDQQSKTRELGRYDVIVSNPPYVESQHPLMQTGDVRFEPNSALVSGEAGLDDIQIIVRDAPKHLNANGWLALEHGYQQAAKVQALLTAQGFDHVTTLRDLSANPRVTLGRLSAQ